MKKIFTLLVTVTIATSVFAQYNKPNNQKDFNPGKKEVVYNDGRFKNDDRRDNHFYSFSARERDMQIFQINREYNNKTQKVKNRLFVPRFKKEHIICELNHQREDEIKMVYRKFNDRNNRYNDRDNRFNDRDGRRHS